MGEMTLVDPATIQRIAEFLNARRSRWYRPWAGYPVGRVRLTLRTDSSFLAAVEIGPDFLVLNSPGPSAVMTLSTLAHDSLEHMALCDLPSLVAPYDHVDNTTVLEFPDSGGVIANGQVFADSALRLAIAGMLNGRLLDLRAILTWPVPLSRCRDLLAYVAVAHAARGRVFDAAKSGWPRVVGVLPRSRP